MTKNDAAELITRLATKHRLALTSLSFSGWLFPSTSFCVRGDFIPVERFEEDFRYELTRRMENRRQITEEQEARKMKEAREWLAKSNVVTRLVIRYEALLLTPLEVGFVGTCLGLASSIVFGAMLFANAIPVRMALLAPTLLGSSLLCLWVGLKASSAPKAHICTLLATQDN